MTRLCGTTVRDLPDDVATPGYDRAKISVGIVHLGNGAFHKAHEAVYTDDVLARDLARRLEPWFAREHRDLSWRRTRDS